MLGVFLDWVHRALGRRRFFVQLALKLRNQARAVIRYRLSDGNDLRCNGEDWLVRLVARPRGVFMDVGANVGDWAALWLQVDPEPELGLLVEPSREAAATLRRRFERLPQLHVVETGLADRVGTMVFFEEPGAGERSSFVDIGLRRARPRSSPVTTVDDELTRWNIARLDFLKVDVEGYDLRVLHGATNLLARHAVSFVQFEYNAEWALAGSTLAAARHFLGDLGYTVYLLKRDGLWVLDYSTYGEFFAYSNFVAVCPSAREVVAPHVRGPL